MSAKASNPGPPEGAIKPPPPPPPPPKRYFREGVGPVNRSKRYESTLITMFINHMQLNGMWPCTDGDTSERVKTKDIMKLKNEFIETLS